MKDYRRLFVSVKSKRGHRVIPFSVNRRMAAASVAVCRDRNTIHTITEVDVTEPRRLINEHKERTGERLSLTAYIVASLARTVKESPEFNAFRVRNKLIVLDDITIGTLIERKLDDEYVPEPIGIRAADKLSFRRIHGLVRAAKRQTEGQLGALSGIAWVMRVIPSAFFKVFVRLASRSIRMARRYGVVTVTAVGMFGPSPMWLVPLSAATVAVAVGGIVNRVVMVDGSPAELEHLCLTISFDHDLIDRAPAARFTKRFAELISKGEALIGETVGSTAPSGILRSKVIPNALDSV